MWDWSQFTTNNSPFKDKGTVEDKVKNKEKIKDKDKDKGLSRNLFESSRREAPRLRYVASLPSHHHRTFSRRLTFSYIVLHDLPNRTPETPKAIETPLPAPAPVPAPVPWLAGGGPASAAVTAAASLPLPLPHWKPAAPRPATVAAPVATTSSDTSQTAVTAGPRPSTSDHPQDNVRITSKDDIDKDKNGNQKSVKDRVVASDNKQTKNNSQIDTAISVKDVKNANDHADRAAFNAAAFNASFYAGTDLTRARNTI